jgi:hypothetical protein
VGVRVDEAGYDGPAIEFHDPGVTVSPRIHVTEPTDRQHAPAADGEGRRRRAAGIEGEDAAVEEDRGGGYFIQPFSR